MEVKEHLLTSSKASQHHSAALYNYQTGNIIHLYKNGGTIAPGTLGLISDDYLIAGEESKATIQLWPVNSQEPIKKLTTILPIRPKLVKIAPNNSYIAGALGTKLYVWHISSGKLFSVQKRHFQDISVLEFSPCGKYLVVGGEDGMLVAYLFVDLITMHGNSDLGQVEALFTKTDHSQAITGLHVGEFERLATVSRDQTAKIYQLCNGQLLLSLVFDCLLTSVKFDASCWELYVGKTDGFIQQFHLREPPRSLEHHVTDDALQFRGHTKAITCLDLNSLNTNLASGSEDGFVFIWELKSRQIVRRLNLQGSVTNLAFVPGFAKFQAQQNFKPQMQVRVLDRELIQDEKYLVSVLQTEDYSSEEEEVQVNKGNTNEVEVENSNLRSINKQLYEAALAISKKYNQF